jgi:hypothetical protein
MNESIQSEKIFYRVVLVFIAGGSQSHLENMHAQRKYCFSKVPSTAKCLWLIADTSYKEVTLIDEVLYIPVEDTYTNLLLKTKIAFDWISENLDFDFLLRSNTSNYFNFDELFETLSDFDSKKELYAGALGEYKHNTGTNSRYINYVSGSGILLSRTTVNQLRNIKSGEYDELVEDVAIGDFLSTKSIRPTELDRNNVTDWEFLTHSYQVRLKAWHSDKLTIRRFRRISKIFNAGRIETLLRYLAFEALEAIYALRHLKLKQSFRLFCLSTRYAKSFNSRKRHFESV